MEIPLTRPERATHARIATLIQGNAEPGKHAQDAFHLVEKRQERRTAFHHRRRQVPLKLRAFLDFATPRLREMLDYKTA